MSQYILANDEKWYAKDEALYTVICADDGNTYIRTMEETWKIYQEPTVLNTDLPNIDHLRTETKQCKPKTMKPKRITRYNTFLKDTLLNLKQSRPELSCNERMKLAAEMWNSCKNSGMALSAE